MDSRSESLPTIVLQQRHADRLAAWKAAFGEALVILPMGRAQLVGGCVVRDFLSLCAGESGAVPLVEKIPNENRSLNPAGVAFIRSLHRTLQKRNPARDPNRARMLQRMCTHLEALPTFGEGRLAFPAALRWPLGTAFAEDASRGRLSLPAPPASRSHAP